MTIEDLELPLPAIEFVLAEDCPALPTLRFVVPNEPGTYGILVGTRADGSALEAKIARAILGSCVYCNGEIAAVGCENDECLNSDEGAQR